MKKTLLFFSVCLLLVACINKEPELAAEIIITDLTEEQFDTVEGAGDATKDDFKKLAFNFTMKNSKNIEREITMFQDWKGVLKEHYWAGSGSVRDNLIEDTVEYHTEIIVYAKGLSETDIKELFGDAHIHVEWKQNDETYSENIFLKDMITYQ
ncbi:hypothetical protein P9B03_06780 [Metasolibacillus meyeri]|uniref:Lipoprotein n=1 Tax=Metasolibacillus meyeri TaxID=1071052 RepID=A0AAW9NQN4_9BACL|nr:hypothetical protein [Metasolibacillus meyeri]MEC1178183.1 hypothetical protein [Metasolibacillus meyeri]